RPGARAPDRGGERGRRLRAGRPARRPLRGRAPPALRDAAAQPNGLLAPRGALSGHRPAGERRSGAAVEAAPCAAVVGKTHPAPRRAPGGRPGRREPWIAFYQVAGTWYG